MYNLSSNASLADLHAATLSFCNLTWSEIVALYSSSPNFLFASSQCLRGMYIYSVLVQAYGFDADSSTIQFMTTIDNVELSWTLGAMLFEADQLPFSCKV